MCHSKLRLVLFVLCIFTAPSAFALNLITNGSFENPNLASNPNPAGNNVGSGSAWEVFNSIEGWNTVSGAGIEIQRSGTVVNAHHGNQYVELDSHPSPGSSAGSNSIMGQSISGLTVGSDLTLSFWYRPRTNNGWNDNGIDVYWGESGSESLVFSIVNQLARDYTDWVNFTLGLTVTNSSMNLGFGASGLQNTLGGFIDDVSLVPSPATGLLFGLGLFLLAWTGRSRNSRFSSAS